MLEGRTEAAVDLILAVFRLAAADYAGVAYGFDGELGSRRVRVSPETRLDAALFLRGPWARFLADWVGFSADEVWRRAEALRADHPTAVTPALTRVA